MANMILGMIIMHKRYNPQRYISVAMISLGIAICTIASGRDMKVCNTRQLMLSPGLNEIKYSTCDSLVL